MFKVLKIYLKNSKELLSDEIYCIRLNFNEELETLKNKVFLRCPKLQNEDSQIYWYDLENDKIRITCDDDLKFFMEESACHKLIFDFCPETEHELSRKRSSTQTNEEIIEGSKRIRKQLENIDLSSDSSLMDTDEDDDVSFVGETSSTSDSKNSSVNNIKEKDLEEIPSSSSGKKSPNIQIISVDIIKPSSENTEIIDENQNETVENETVNKEAADDNLKKYIEFIDDNILLESQSEETSEPNLESLSRKKEKEQEETNRIIISDSSDNDDDDDDDINHNDDDDRKEDYENNNQGRSAGPSASASSYSFTNVNNEGNESGTFCGNRNGQQYSHSFRRQWRPNTHHRAHSFNEQRRHHFNEQRRQFDDQMRNMNRTNAENMERIHQHARMAGEHAARAFRASTSAIPDLVSTFQAHFRRPLFNVADFNQHFFSGFQRR